MKITTGFLTGNLTANAGRGVHESATARRFAEALTAAIRERFPGAEVRVDWREGSGFLPQEFWTAVDCDPGHGEVEKVDEVVGRVIRRGGFHVREEEAAK